MTTARPPARYSAVWARERAASLPPSYTITGDTIGAEALACQLGNRQAFVTSIAQGLGSAESGPKSASADEVRAPAEDVAKRLR